MHASLIFDIPTVSLQLLNALGFSFGCPTSLSFLHHYIHVQLMPQVSATLHPGPQQEHNATPSAKANHLSQQVHTPSSPHETSPTSTQSDSTPAAACKQPHAAAPAASSHASRTTSYGAEHFCRMAEVLLCVQQLDPSYSQHLPSVSAAAALYATSLLFRQPGLVPAIFVLSKASAEVISELGSVRYSTTLS